MDESAIPASGPIATFVGGATGGWHVRSQRAVSGPSLSSVPRVAVIAQDLPKAEGAWRVRGAVSAVRYVNAAEQADLTQRQEGLGRPEAEYGAMILVRKSAAWWALPQDKRRAIFEEQSRHIAVGTRYLPAIARQLYHSRDLGEAFDFVTWFEFASTAEPAFDEMLVALRQTKEWTFIDREIDFRLKRLTG